jgi:four helix bundle protein
MESGFRRLAAYEAAVRVADDLHDVVAAWRSLDQWSVGVQLLRSVDSIGANIAEAAGRERRLDRRRFLVIARGSLYETEHWLARAETRGLIAHGYTKRLDDIARPLSGLIRRLS